MVNITVFSDESGVFDKKHNDFYVFAGLVFIDDESIKVSRKMYKKAESTVRCSSDISSDVEIKACNISNAAKGSLFRSLNNFEKFGIVIDQKELVDDIFRSKMTKQRYLDSAFTLAVREKLDVMIRRRIIDPSKVNSLKFCIDNHSNTGDKIYEFRETLEETFKEGIINKEAVYYRKPLFSNLQSVQIEYCDSKKNVLIRASDIIANKLFFMAVNNDFTPLRNRNFDVVTRP